MNTSMNTMSAILPRKKLMKDRPGWVAETTTGKEVSAIIITTSLGMQNKSRKGDGK